jgi:26S proteasome regulatory subunit N7
LDVDLYSAEMAPYYKIVTSTSALPLDQELLDSMETQNKEELQKIEDRLTEAEKTEGESEIADALRAKATYLTRIGNKVRLFEYYYSKSCNFFFLRLKDRAVEAQKLALEKTPGIGSRIDIVLTLVRLGFFFGDHELITSHLTKAEEYVCPAR